MEYGSFTLYQDQDHSLNVGVVVGVFGRICCSNSAQSHEVMARIVGHQREVLEIRMQFEVNPCKASELNLRLLTLLVPCVQSTLWRKRRRHGWSSLQKHPSGA
jgi:hypothetical protein